MKYQIKVNYETGDSFGYENASTRLELTWKNLDVAKQNLQRIKEHYQQYKEIHDLRGYIKKDKLTLFELLEQNRTKDWFVYKDRWIAYKKDITDYWAVDESQKKECKKKGYNLKLIPDQTIAENCIVLYTDEGATFQFWAPWCGYFETLHGAEIINWEDESDNNDLKFTI